MDSVPPEAERRVDEALKGGNFGEVALILDEYEIQVLKRHTEHCATRDRVLALTFWSTQTEDFGPSNFHLLGHIYNFDL